MHYVYFNVHIFKRLLCAFNFWFKFQDLYLDTLKIGHKYCSMLSILNRLILQNDKQYVSDKKVKTQQHKKQTKKSLPEPRLEPGTLNCRKGKTSRTAIWCVTATTETTLSMWIVVKYTKPTMQDTLCQQNPFFRIWTCMGYYIWQFLIWIGVAFVWFKVRFQQFWSNDKPYFLWGIACRIRALLLYKACVTWTLWLKPVCFKAKRCWILVKR